MAGKTDKRRPTDEKKVSDNWIPCKHHRWADGWVCEKCGLLRADYEEAQKKGKR